VSRDIHPGLVYTAARLGLLLAVGLAGYLIGFRSWALLIVSLLVSLPLSYGLLRGPREAFAARLVERSRRRQALRARLGGDDRPRDDEGSHGGGQPPAG